MSWTTPPLPADLNGVVFVATSITDTVRRRLVRHEYPGRDGAELEDLGAAPRTVVVDALLTGETWLYDLAALESAAASPGVQTLTHPQFGPLRGRVEGFDITHQSEEHDIARIRLTFVAGDVREEIFALQAGASAAAAALRDAVAELVSVSEGL